MPAACWPAGSCPARWGLNSLTLIDFSLDTEKLWGWKGGLFGIQFLQFSGQTTNELAGAFPGFDSLPGAPPLVRQEIYQLWYRQSLFEDRLIVRIGKIGPTYDFGNVVRPVPVRDPSAAIPSVTGLIYDARLRQSHDARRDPRLLQLGRGHDLHVHPDRADVLLLWDL